MFCVLVCIVIFWMLLLFRREGSVLCSNGSFMFFD